MGKLDSIPLYEVDVNELVRASRVVSGPAAMSLTLYNSWPTFTDVMDIVRDRFGIRLGPFKQADPNRAAASSGGCGGWLVRASLPMAAGAIR